MLIEINPKVVLATICKNYPWAANQLSCFNEFLLWDMVSQNENMTWSEKTIDTFSDKLDFGFSGGLSSNNSVIFTPQLIEKYKNKWDWMILTDNPNIPWSLDLIEKYKDNWCWESIEFAGNVGLSSNVYLPWSEYMIDKYADRWFWGELSSNPSLPWSLGLIKKYEEKWTWDGHYGLWGLSINQSPVVQEILNTYYPERIDKIYNVPRIPTPCIEDNLFEDTIVKVFSKHIKKADIILSDLNSKVR